MNPLVTVLLSPPQTVNVFDPADYGTVLLELDPAVGFTPGSWVAKTGTYTGLQATEAKQPTLNATDANYNNKPSVSFAAGSSQDMVGDAPNLGNQWTLFVVGEMGNVDGTCMLNWYNNAAGGNTGVRLFKETAGVAYSAQDNVGAQLVAGGASATKRGIFVMRVDADSLDAYYNGSADGTPDTWSGTSYATLDKLRLGSLGPFFFLTGKIAYLAAFQGAIDPAPFTEALNTRFAQF